jgi:peptidoglycan/LPS O-acetylase OafA/YrhL
LFFAKDFWHTNPQVWTFLLVPQAWSLALELMFYLIAPFLVRLRIVTLGALILATLLLRSYVSQQLRLTGDPWSYRFFPTELGLFLLGILSHSVFVERPVDPYLKKVCGVFGVLLIVVTVLYSFLSQGDESFRWVYFTIAFLGIPAIFEYSKTSKIDRALGDLSYPLYISHYGVFEAVKRVSEHTHARWLNVDVEYVCAFIVAYLLNRYVIERLEVRRRAPAQTV